MFECAFLCIHCHAAVVAHMFVTAGSYVEERSLSAVRITDQGYLDDLSPGFRQCSHLSLEIRLALGVQSRQGLPFGKHLLRLGLTDDLDL